MGQTSTRLWFAAAALGATGLLGCGPDPYLGSYTGTAESTTVLERPFMSTGSDTSNTSFTIAMGMGADYAVTFSTGGSSSTTCTLNANRSGASIVFPTGQMCTSSMDGTMTTATLTSGTATVTGHSLTGMLNFTFMGRRSGIDFNGTLAVSITATRAAM